MFFVNFDLKISRKDNCFCLHGYPEWHKFHGKPKPKPRKQMNVNTKFVTAAHVTTSEVRSSEQSLKDITTNASLILNANN